MATSEKWGFGRGHMCAGCDKQLVLHRYCIKLAEEVAERRAEEAIAKTAEAKKLVVEKPPEKVI